MPDTAYKKNNIFFNIHVLTLSVEWHVTQRRVSPYLLPEQGNENNYFP